MIDYENIDTVKKLLSESQEAERDNREKVREVNHFLKKEDGQWEPEIVSIMSNKPRYTFDKCNPVVDSIAGEIEQAEFGIKIRPAGGDATEDLAQTYNGMIRNIQSMSNGTHIFNASGRKMVESGFDVWRVVQDWADTDSFDQDLFIRKIANAVDRVWFDTGAEMQDMSDAGHCFVLQALTKDEYKIRFPKGSEQSIGDSKTSQVYYYKPDFIIVGEILYKKPTTKDIVLMSNNAVYVDDEKFQQVKDELAQAGVTEVRRRKKQSHIVMSRFFDGKDFLSPAKETVFSYLPVIPVYGNFDISEDKVIYRGAVEKLMDSQRVYNYTQSRQVEEGALAPRDKYWITRDQAKADITELQTMNTNSDPVQFYTHVPDQPAPYRTGGANVNPGLAQVSADMAQNIVESSGIFAANQGNAPDQSGFAIELQQNKGDTSTIKYFKAVEIAITHTAKILVDAIPKVYDTKRIVRILGEDGTSKMVTLHDTVIDNETGKIVSLNDLSKGKYDVTCDIGPAFKNRQQETARAFLEAAGIDPSLITTAKDIWLANLNAPGFDQIAERARKELLEAGAIPDSQMTDEEKERMQQMLIAAQNEEQQPNPIQDAILEQTQANTADIISKAQERTDKTQLESEKLRQNEMQMILKAQEADRKQDMEERQAMFEMIKTQAQTLEIIRNAMGVDTVIGQKPAETYKQQTEILDESQDNAGEALP